MFKKQILALALSFSFLAPFSYAAPRVGDSATYAVSSGDFAFTMTVAITEFNSETGLYKQVNTTVEDGLTSTEESWVTAESITSTEEAAAIVEGCEMVGGIKKSITVPAGDFETCELQEQGVLRIQIAAVPFGTVYFEGVDADTKITIELQSYQMGQ